jgi:hypothetical protein
MSPIFSKAPLVESMFMDGHMKQIRIFRFTVDSSTWKVEQKKFPSTSGPHSLSFVTKSMGYITMTISFLWQRKKEKLLIAMVGKQ